MDSGEVQLTTPTSRVVKSYVPSATLESVMLSGVGRWFVDQGKCQLQTTGRRKEGDCNHCDITPKGKQPIQTVVTVSTLAGGGSKSLKKQKTKNKKVKMKRML